MEPQGWRTPPLLQSTKRTRTAVLKKTTRTESVHVQAVGLDAGNLPGTEPVERCFLLTSPFIGPSGGRIEFEDRIQDRSTSLSKLPASIIRTKTVAIPAGQNHHGDKSPLRSDQTKLMARPRARSPDKKDYETKDSKIASHRSGHSRLRAGQPILTMPTL